jgi:ribonucleoside-diphosphate reductase alpha chain
MDISNRILSDITVYMKYAKYIPELKRRETWQELVTRNMDMHIKQYPKLEKEIRENYMYVYKKQVLPSMRSMQFAGKPIEISPNRIYNCAFAPIDDWRVFSEIMFLLLGGTGVGYSVQKHHVELLPEIRKPNKERGRRWLVADSIEGWADAIKVLVKSYFFGGSHIEFDFSDIRPKGARLVTSGGKAPGPQPLKECLIKLEGILDSKQDGEKLRPIEVHDMVCHIADAVLAGGIRRAALISLFSASDDEMIAC